MRMMLAIVGADYSGPICVAYPAPAGLRVTVLEKNAAVREAAVAKEFGPGLGCSVAACAGEPDPHSGAATIGCPAPLSRAGALLK